MECQHFQDHISEFLDHELDSAAELALKHHMEVCSVCRGICQDLVALSNVGWDREEFDPPARVWKGIQSQLRAEGLARSKSSWRFWVHIFPQGVDSAFKPALAGALVTLVLVFSTYFVVKKSFYKEVAPVSSQAVVLDELGRAEAQYIKAIEDLQEVSQKRLAGADPKLAQVLNDNLATMDYYLKECKEAAQANPGNPLVQSYLLAAYQKKVELLETIVNSDTL